MVDQERYHYSDALRAIPDRATALNILSCLKKWLDIAEGDVTDYRVMRNGLCDWVEDYHSYAHVLVLQKMFLYGGFDRLFPFGKDFRSRQKNYSLHQCPHRLKWVRETIKDLELWLTQ